LLNNIRFSRCTTSFLGSNAPALREFKESAGQGDAKAQSNLEIIREIIRVRV